MQNLYILYDETFNLVDIDAGATKTIRIPTELSGVVQEEVIMLVNEEAIAGATGTITGYIMSLMFPDDPVEAEIDWGTPTWATLLAHFSDTSANPTDIRYVPDNTDVDFMAMGLEAEHYAILQRKTWRKYTAGDDILVMLTASTVSEAAQNENEFAGAGDSVRIVYAAKYGVFC